jgi:hypothetical protein
MAATSEQGTIAEGRGRGAGLQGRHQREVNEAGRESEIEQQRGRDTNPVQQHLSERRPVEPAGHDRQPDQIDHAEGDEEDEISRNECHDASPAGVVIIRWPTQGGSVRACDAELPRPRSFEKSVQPEPGAAQIRSPRCGVLDFRFRSRADGAAGPGPVQSDAMTGALYSTIGEWP